MANGATCSVGVCNGVVCTTVVSLGGQCNYDSFVCQVGLSCQQTCQPPGATGTLCASNVDCQDGLTCPLTVTVPVCTVRSDAGQSCDVVDCQAGLACGALADGGTSCQALVARGPCVAGSDGGICKEAEYCTDAGCAPMPVIGQPCAQDSDCAVGLCLTSVCTLGPAGTPCSHNSNCLSQRCDLSASQPTCVASCLQ
jgi:hypothetical protein